MTPTPRSDATRPSNQHEERQREKNFEPSRNSSTQTQVHGNEGAATRGSHWNTSGEVARGKNECALARVLQVLIGTDTTSSHGSRYQVLIGTGRIASDGGAPPFKGKIFGFRFSSEQTHKLSWELVTSSHRNEPNSTKLSWQSLIGAEVQLSTGRIIWASWATALMGAKIPGSHQNG